MSAARLSRLLKIAKTRKCDLWSWLLGLIVTLDYLLTLCTHFCFEVKRIMFLTWRSVFKDLYASIFYVNKVMDVGHEYWPD